MSERYTLDQDGDFDELVMNNATVHIERMDDGHIWMGFYKQGGKSVVLDFYAHRRLFKEPSITVVPQQNDLA